MILWYFPGIQVQVEVKFYRWTTPGSVFMAAKPQRQPSLELCGKEDLLLNVQLQRTSHAKLQTFALHQDFKSHKSDESGVVLGVKSIILNVCVLLFLQVEEEVKSWLEGGEPVSPACSSRLCWLWCCCLVSARVRYPSPSGQSRLQFKVSEYLDFMM